MCKSNKVLENSFFQREVSWTLNKLNLFKKWRSCGEHAINANHLNPSSDLFRPHTTELKIWLSRACYSVTTLVSTISSPVLRYNWELYASPLKFRMQLFARCHKNQMVCVSYNEVDKRSYEMMISWKLHKLRSHQREQRFQ